MNFFKVAEALGSHCYFPVVCDLNNSCSLVQPGVFYPKLVDIGEEDWLVSFRKQPMCSTIISTGKYKYLYGKVHMLAKALNLILKEPTKLWGK